MLLILPISISILQLGRAQSIDKKLQIELGPSIWKNNLVPEKFEFQEEPKQPGERWLAAALKDIAYYLRNHKFNEWDRRFYREKPSIESVGYYSLFPQPPLDTLHWNVVENCDTSFAKCVAYLHTVVRSVLFGGSNEIIRNKTSYENITLTLRTEFKRDLSTDKSAPFDNFMVRFQWRTSASYYMCWYTMKGVPALSMIGEACDNFAEFAKPVRGLHNRDVRSDDRQSFACALYSFCPDPCCPKKLVKDIAQCRDSEENPCFQLHAKGKPSDRQCNLNRMENQNFDGIITNRWNVSCKCHQPGFIWKSQFGMCVDINECITGDHTCNVVLEDCLNLPGTFQCVCKWGFIYEDKIDKCVPMYDVNDEEIIEVGPIERQPITLFEKIKKYFATNSDDEE